MQRQLPSIISLNCFEASARHESFTKAADELCLTHSAVSRQVNKLEQLLGCNLFERIKQRLYLTDAGKEYEIKVRDILSQLESATKNLRKNISGRLRVGVEPALTTCWLIPKLSNFQANYPDIEIDIVTDINQLYGLREGYDVGILYGDGLWSEFNSNYFMPEKFVAVCTADLFAQYGSVTNLKEVLKYPLLHHTASPSTTKYWLKEAGLTEDEIKALPGQRFNQFQLLVDAATQGLGLAVVPHYFVADKLESGDLVQACTQLLLSDQSYYVVSQKNRTSDLKVKAFCEWLLSWSTKKQSE